MQHKILKLILSILILSGWWANLIIVMFHSNRSPYVFEILLVICTLGFFPMIVWGEQLERTRDLREEQE